jgi:hypothetical protein
MWHGLKLEVLSLKHRTSKCGKNEGPLIVPPFALVIGCFLVLAMRAEGASLTKTNGKRYTSSKALGDGTKTIQHSLLGR